MYSTLCGAYHISESPQMDKVELKNCYETLRTLCSVHPGFAAVRARFGAVAFALGCGTDFVFIPNI
jgi:hypothetical protein